MHNLYWTFLLLTVPLVTVDSVTVIKNNESIIAEAIIQNLGLSTSRPVLDPNTVTNVTLEFMLIRIIELNDVNQELKIASWTNMKWQDERITWNASEYGVNCVYIPVNEIWIPDLTLENNVDEEYNQFQPNTPVEVCSDGRVNYSTYTIFRSSCHISIALFPFDNQTCTLRFSSWIYDIFHLDINPHILTSDQGYLFEDYGVWRLLSIEKRRKVNEYKENIHPFVYAVFTIYIRRRYRFYFLFILIPYSFCSVLICLMFFIPFESGEKLSYGITAVLGLIVFQEIIAMSLPPVGNESSVIGKFFTSVIGIGIMSLIVEIIVYNIYMQGNAYKACVYIMNCCRTKKEVPLKETRSKRHSEHTQEHQEYTEVAAKTNYCEIFEFCSGILCLVSLIILMLWLLVVI
ncbi:neuronal acetylcholine receptor subunit alpha-10-like isoform X2 [Anneissia japonica]|uniref:neuronal acetylcholine receptor subunit alpha-10-like isoform X1 n=2 Tax=Anneissia japonica TaxID=1529436 RepID=UPI001425615E|nr:neuronal acetylcholine receptor subunit alpha-10-like isoform X1 [Anneissia japonica]XP_033112746.1 neuronal acetylcholine receptor subunit alpha-10-like isoform X2 [Anneissia japonica]